MSIINQKIETRINVRFLRFLVQLLGIELDEMVSVEDLVPGDSVFLREFWKQHA